MPPQRPQTPSGLVLEPFRGLRLAEGHRGDTRLAGAVSGHVGRSAAVADQLHQWRRDGTLTLEAAPSLYCYDITPVDGPRVAGLIGALRLVPAMAGIVLPHEDTMAAAVAGRLAFTEAVAVDLEPIFLLYDGGPAAASAIDTALTGPLVIDDLAADGTRHRVAVLAETATVSAISAEIAGRQALIADGHHRYETYLARQANSWAHGSGPGPWDAGLAYLVDANRAGPRVLPMHRVLAGLPYPTAVDRATRAGRVRPLPDGTADSMLTALQQSGAGTEATAHDHGPAFVLAAGAHGVLVDRLDSTALAATLPSDRGSAWGALDVVALHHYVIPVVFGMTDDEQSVRADQDPQRALASAARVDGTAVLLRAPSSGDVLAVAVDGDRMPRKSTRFLPKPRSGLVLRPVDAAT